MYNEDNWLEARYEDINGDPYGYGDWDIEDMSDDLDEMMENGDIPETDDEMYEMLDNA